jgi:MFS family permease
VVADFPIAPLLRYNIRIMATTPSQPAHDPYAALRSATVWRYLLGTTLVQIGMGAQGLAIGWELYQRTHQPLALGYGAGVQAIPMILLSLPAGYLADRFDRRTLIALTLLGVAACSLGLAWLSAVHGPTNWMYLLLLLDATMMTLGRPASAAILPTLVPPELLENAMKWRMSLFQVSALGGPALGALIVGWYVPGAYWLNALAALLFIALLFSLRLRPSPAAAGTMTLASVLGGVRFVWGQKVILAAASLDMFAVLLGGATYLLPIFATTLHSGPPNPAREAHLLGLLRMAPALGALAMGIVMAHLPPMKHAGRAMLLAVAGFGAATIVFGFSKLFWLSWAMLFLTGVLDNVSVVVRHTLIQLLTPDAMRGRVSAVNSIFIGSSNEIGGLESGVVAQWLGPVLSVVTGGIGTVLVVALWSAIFPHLRRFGVLSGSVEVEETAAAGG